MKQKGLSLLLILGVVFVFAGVSMANVPPPPVNQNLFFPDTLFNLLTEADCRVCHDSGVPDRHHLLYGSAITAGQCSSANGTCDGGSPCVSDADCPVGETCTVGTPGACIKDADCVQPIDSCFITGDPCPGTCSVSGDPCGEDTQCPVGETCVGGGDCPSSYTGQTCGQPICYGQSALKDSDADNDGTLDTNYGCLNCHEESSSGGVAGFVVERDCLQCHQSGLNQPTVHHQEGGTAQSGNCTSCHGDAVDDPLGCKELCCAASFGGSAGQCQGPCTTDADCSGGTTCVALGAEATCDDGHYIPTYAPSMVTPEPSKHTHACEFSMDPCEQNQDCVSGTCTGAGAEECWDDGNCPVGETCVGGERCDEAIELSPAGACSFCHDEGIDTASGVEVFENHHNHHSTGVYKTRLGGSQRDKCAWCHEAGNPHNTGGHELTRIRFCENCHSPASLHNIQADSPNAANIGTLVVGGEDAYYGHVGRDNPADPDNDSDCWGCHGFSIASAPDTGAIVPSLTDASTLSLIAGTPTEITLTGTAFINTTGTTEYSGVVQVSDSDGAVVAEVAPTSISVSSLTATIPALDTGIYDIRVKKDDVASNPIIINCIPAVVITNSTCEAGVLTVIGSGFGDAQPGADQYINVRVAGITAEIVSWTDTQIVANTSICGEPTVNTLFGSAGAADCCEGDLNADGDVDGSDASSFKTDFGRSRFNAPCSEEACSGDFDCDGDQDGTDASLFKLDFGRSLLNNPCPGCTAADCSY